MKNTIKDNSVSVEKNKNSVQEKLASLIEKEQIAIKNYQTKNSNRLLKGTSSMPSVAKEIKTFIKQEFSKIKL